MPFGEHACSGCERSRRTVPLLCLCLAVPAGYAFGFHESTRLVSVDSSGGQGNGDSGSSSISADGRFISFVSEASNLVPGDNNGVYDVFVHDRTNGQTSRVSLSSSGAEANSHSYDPSISGDGRFVAFVSSARNLVPGDTNLDLDIFVHDRRSGHTTRVSVDSSGVQSDADSEEPSISADGRFVAFHSIAWTLVPGDTNGAWDVFVHDRQCGQTTSVSVDPLGIQGNGWSQYPAISADGRYVAFQSTASNLVPGDTNGHWDAFVHDRRRGKTTRVSVDSSGAQGNGGSGAASISADGRFVAFGSAASNLVPGDTNGYVDVFVHDRRSVQTARVSMDPWGLQANDHVSIGSIAAGGRYVTFYSWATNLVPGDTNGRLDVFRHDRQSGRTSRVSVSSSGVQGNFSSYWPSISADGIVAFTSEATNLVPGDVNGSADAFVHQHADDESIERYCTAKTNSQGCAPIMFWSGFPGVTAGYGFNVFATDVLNNAHGLLFYGVAGRAAIAFQGGTLCLGAPMRRTPVQFSGGNPPPSDCSGQFHFDFNVLIASGVDPDLTAGRTVNCQYWSRDPQASFGSSLTDALEFTIGP